MAEFRQWRETDRVYLKDVVPLDTPYNVAIEISSFCNLRIPSIMDSMKGI